MSDREQDAVARITRDAGIIGASNQTVIADAQRACAHTKLAKI